jgi:putative phage-type endonuclease
MQCTQPNVALERLLLLSVSLAGANWDGLATVSLARQLWHSLTRLSGRGGGELESERQREGPGGGGGGGGVSLSLPQVTARLTQICANRSGLRRLQARDSIPQRTPPWYAARHDMITASDVAQALGKGKFGTQRDFLNKKSSGAAAVPLSLADCPPLKWGVMYEPVANAVYTALTGARVHEFGLLRHPHVDFLGASPDGVTELGVMLEIKCPYRREVIPGGEVPLQYYLQIQAQLEVCDLQECDYLECQLLEPNGSADDFYSAMLPHGAIAHSAPRFCGLLAEFADGDTEYRFEYGPMLEQGDIVTRQTLEEWRDWETAQLRGSHGGIIRRWHLGNLNLLRILRNPEFWAQQIAPLSQVWQTVLKQRECGGDAPAPVAAARTPRTVPPALSGCLFRRP